MSISVMKQALDFLEWFAGDDHSIRPKHKAPEIAAALRQAIEQAEDAVAAEREACADVAGIALLGCERSIRNRVVGAIRARDEK